MLTGADGLHFLELSCIRFPAITAAIRWDVVSLDV